MPDRDAWTCRLASADDVPSRRDEVRDVAHAGIRDRPMGIIGENRLAARRLLAAYHPVIRAFYPAESDVVIDLSHSAEQALIQTHEIETGGGIERTMRVGIDQLVSALRANETDQLRMEELTRAIRDAAQRRDARQRHFDAPALRQKIEQRELDRQPRSMSAHLVDVCIHAGDERRHEHSRVGGVALPLDVHIAAILEQPR